MDPIRDSCEKSPRVYVKWRGIFLVSQFQYGEGNPSAYVYSLCNFLVDKCFLWGHWYPCFGLLVMSPLGFKVRVGSLIYTWWRHTCYTFTEIHLWCNTCGPLSSQHGSWADLFHVPASRHWWDSKPGPIVPQVNALLTEMCQFSCIRHMFEQSNFLYYYLCMPVSNNFFSQVSLCLCIHLVYLFRL